MTFPKIRTGQDRTGQDRTGQDRTGQDRTKRHFPNDVSQRSGWDRTGQNAISKNQDKTKTSFLIRQLCRLDRVSLSHTTLCPKDLEILQKEVAQKSPDNSPRVYDTKGWYCAAATSDAIANKQRKLPKEKIGS